MKKILIIISIFLLFINQVKSEEIKNDYLYSQEYFDYLIDCADYSRQEAIEDEKNANSQDNIKKSEQSELILDNQNNEVSSDYFEPFKLQIESQVFKPYSQELQKEDTKASFQIGKNFSIYQNTTKFRNKYNSSDYRILVGAEYQINDKVSVSSGLETNYRGYDQNPISRKLYITPSLNLTDKFSLKFYNKLYLSDYSSDHDLGLNFSPLKSKNLDLGVYTGLTKDGSGNVSESVNFTTTFYF